MLSVELKRDAASRSLVAAMTGSSSSRMSCTASFSLSTSHTPSHAIMRNSSLSDRGYDMCSGVSDTNGCKWKSPRARDTPSCPISRPSSLTKPCKARILSLSLCEVGLCSSDSLTAFPLRHSTHLLSPALATTMSFARMRATSAAVPLSLVLFSPPSSAFIMSFTRVKEDCIHRRAMPGGSAPFFASPTFLSLAERLATSKASARTGPNWSAANRAALSVSPWPSNRPTISQSGSPPNSPSITVTSCMCIRIPRVSAAPISNLRDGLTNMQWRGDMLLPCLKGWKRERGNGSSPLKLQ
mmetsp:Transcript_948/g.1924  ORF Transcript_948/g.1924 Transcript_948/m.1924 type:complete len:298 (+) Transcript_948:1843-2736(+)